MAAISRAVATHLTQSLQNAPAKPEAGSPAILRQQIHESRGRLLGRSSGLLLAKLIILNGILAVDHNATASAGLLSFTPLKKSQAK